MLSVSALIYSCTITFLAKQTYSRAIKKLALLASLRDIKPYAWIFEKRISKAKDSFYNFATGLICNAQITSTAANQTTTKNYIGLTEGTFKQRYTQHKSTFPTGNFLMVMNYQNTSGNSKTATPALQLNGLSSQEPAPTTIQARDVIYA